MHVLRALTLRLKLILAVVFFTLSGFALYLYHLQITQSHHYFNISQKNFLRQESVASPRGNIVDSCGAVLATSSPCYTIYWQGTGKRALTRHQSHLYNSLSTLLEINPAIENQLKNHERRSLRLKLSSDVPIELLTKLLEQYPNDKNLILEKQYKRHYPYNDLACHIVGYLGLESDGPGKMGLEHLCHNALKGHSGKIIKIINSIGHHLQAHKVNTALAGKTLQTTLDLRLQQIAEELFPEGYEGCLLVMDESGALETVVSRPSFDPGIFLKPLNMSQWKQLQAKNGFLNRAFSACYPPASLFKLVTLAAALEAGVISRDMRWHCIGHTHFKGRDYHCNNKSGHGIVSTQLALAHSCNIPFFEIGKKMKIDTIAGYAHRFGLGEKTGLLFPEKAGLVPSTSWKLRVKKERWWPGETLSASIGQGAFLVTPIQMACMISSINTGYRVRPRILQEEAVLKEALDIKEDTRLFLKSCLGSVIKQGTGSFLKNLDGFVITGKSGTAQVLGLEKQQTFLKKHLHHGYFAAHFQYKKEKPRTLVILIEHAGSSSVAIRLAHKFLKRYSQLPSKSN